MSGFTSSGFRSTVSGFAAVAITGLILWSFHAYVGYLERNAPSTSTAQIESGASMSDRDTRNG